MDEPLSTIQIRLTREVIDRIDRYRLGMPMRPSRSMTIRFLIEHALAIAEEQKGGPRGGEN